MNKSKTPSLRFEGFSDDWEQRKLEDMYNIVSGFAFKLSDYSDSGVPIVNGESINHGEVSSNNWNYLPENFRMEYNNYLLKKNDIVLGLNRPITNGNLKIAQIPSALDKSLLYQRAGKVEIIKDTDVNFSYQLLNREIHDFVIKEAQGSDQPFISTTKLKKWNYLIPKTDEEQTKIGNFFKQLDDTITLQERELNLLKEQKKGFLQKMFPKDNEKVPELRFEGFNDAWEQRKAKNIFEHLSEKGRPDLPVLSVTQDRGVVYRKEVGIDIKYDDSTLMNYKVINPGDFIISLRSFQGGFELSNKLGITSPAYTVFIPKESGLHDNQYWRTKFKTFQFIESLKTVTFGIRDGKSISFSEFGDLKIFVPYLNEQAQIGKFFKKFDDAITLQEQQLEKLKEMKKGFLQKMFI
ncbi:restriction endonuclease subunit S [Vagococcus carniphilus]|uniref:Restriction endonuclease subunit S n=1 Tax=Vagococcus carniphilus TaxID=218144 RepID=A0AAW8U624_9ENTE|nr:restriction endonuclease subunit S [Vagococcus carniphilus]MDT2834554.1 restriction endonuclease subunit S [Vagococcus carniphilus]